MRAKNKMSEFFLELFSEEVPAKLQVKARKNLHENFKNFFEENKVFSKEKFNVFSTPNRLIFYIKKVPKQIKIKAEEIRGPGVSTPDKALEGFIRSNKIKKNQIFKKKTEKGIFYFYKKESKKIKIVDLFKQNIPTILDKILWDKSMKWGNYELFWGRPLKSILAVFDGKKIEFDYHHLKSSNCTFIDKKLEEKTRIFNDYKSYNSYFRSIGVTIDHEKRKSIIRNDIIKLANKKKLKIDLKEKLLDEITNIVEKPKILLCEFDKKFLEVPKEILITAMQNHQKRVGPFF